MAISSANSRGFVVRFGPRVLVLWLMGLVFPGNPVVASDPELTTDFGISVTAGDHLKFTGFRNLPEEPLNTMGITMATETQFPGITGLGLSPASIRFGPNALNSIHSHPRANEIFFLLWGELEVGVIDNRNRLYTSVLKAGDVFVFPKGLLHFQLNVSKRMPATAIAVFSSENAGRDSIVAAMFNSEPRISSEILERVFQLDATTVGRLRNFNFSSPI